MPSQASRRMQLPRPDATPGPAACRRCPPHPARRSRDCDISPSGGDGLLTWVPRGSRRGSLPRQHPHRVGVEGRLGYVERQLAQRPGVTRALVQAGADVLSVGESRHSLEDVYLELIDTDEEASRR